MRLYLFLFVILLGCTSARQPVAQPSSTLVIHADTDFTTSERIVIHRATRSLMSQVGLRVEVIYDLDFRKVERLSSLDGAVLLTRVARDAPLTREMDARFHGITFGWTTLTRRRAYLASDVLSGGGETLFLHVVQHEFLHLVGCEHVSDPESVLFWATDHKHMAVVLSEADRLEYLRATSPGGVTRHE